MLFDSQFNDGLFENNVNDILLENANNGFLKGNMFTNEYIGYKSFKYNNLDAIDEKNKLLLKIYECEFAIIDLSLYLDLHPNNTNLYSIYRNYVKKFNDLKEDFESKYTPLDKCFEKYEEYKWIDNPWPWDSNGGIKYV